MIAAVVGTARRHRPDRSPFADFTASTRMDLSVTEYPTRADLSRYVRGSAAVIGLRGAGRLRAGAESAAAAPGVACQPTNSLRDVGGDLERDRGYPPTVEPAPFAWTAPPTTRVVTDPSP